MHPIQYQSFNVSVLNTNGLGSKDKRLKLREFFKDHSGPILLQESHCSQSLSPRWQSELKLGKLLGCHGTTSSRGVLTFCGKTTHIPLDNNSKNTWDDGNGRILSSLHKSQNRTIGIVNVYAPNLNQTSQSTENYLEFLDKVEEAINQIEMSDVVIVAGDFNLIFNKLLDAQGGNPTLHNLCIEKWDLLKEKFLLSDIYRDHYGTEPLFTWDPMNKRCIRRRLDYILARIPQGGQITVSSPLRIALSDHSVLECKITLPLSYPKGPGYWRHNSSFSSDPSFINPLKERILIFKNAEETYCMDPHKKWEALKQLIREYSIEYSKQKSKERKKNKSRLTKHLEVIQERCYADPDNKLFSAARAEIQSQLDKVLLDEGKATIFRSKVQYVEEGEKCTKFFFQQIKYNNKNANIESLNINGRRVWDPTEIRKHATKFYADLYKVPEASNDNNMTFLKTVDNLLSKQTSENIDRKISRAEVAKALKSMKSGRSPGNDGITVDLYQALWPAIDTLYLDMIYYSLRLGKLPCSMRQSVIKLLHKKGRDPEDITSYRPISLMNYDAKIFSKIMANRLLSSLTDLISPEQLGFMSERYIGEGVLTAELLMEKYENENEGLFVNLDFFKAFDCISHSYIQNVLSSMGFGSNFLNMFRTLYYGAESTVMTNGLTGGYFPLDRSCRQGCCLSPYLFILAIEPLLRAIKKSSAKGLTLGSAEVKLSAYADDITLFLRDNESLVKAEDILNKFESISGLKVNPSKSELFFLGNYNHEILNFSKVETFKITGVSIGYDKQLVNNANFEKPLTKLKSNFNLWKSRSLSLLGKVLVTKAQGLSILNYLASNVSVPKHIIKQVETEVYKFIWGKRDWVKRDVLAKSFQDGGVSLHRFQTTIASNKIQWLQRAERSSSPWATEILSDFSAFGGLSLFRGPIHKDIILQLKHSRSKDIVNAWNELATLPQGPEIGMLNVHFSNKACTANKEALYRPTLLKLGFFQVSHFFYEGKPMTWAQATNAGLKPINFLDFRAIISAIPQEWKDQMKHWNNEKYDKRFLGTWDNEGNFYDLQTLSAKKAKYLATLKQTSTVPTFRSKVGTWHMSQSDWQYFHQQVPRLFWSTKLRSFQYKLLTGVLFGREDIFAFGHISSPECIFCKHPKQSRHHLFYECQNVKDLRHLILRHFLLQTDAFSTERLCYLGSSHRPQSNEEVIQFRDQEFLTVLINRFIYVCNFTDMSLNLSSFLSFVADIRSSEMEVAQRRDRMINTLTRWEAISQNLGL